MSPVRRYFQHVFNPLHIYCRLRDVGVHPPSAMKVTMAYSRFIHRYLVF